MPVRARKRRRVGDFPPCLSPSLFLSEGGRIERETEGSEFRFGFRRTSAGIPARKSLSVRGTRRQHAQPPQFGSVVDALEGGRYPSSFVVADLAAARRRLPGDAATVTEPGAERKVIDWRVRQVMEEGISGAQIGVPNQEGQDNAI